MEHVGVYDAKTRLPSLLEKVRKGQQVTITKHGVPIALIVPYRVSASPSIDETIAKIKKLRKGVSLGGQTVRQAMEKGRRY